MKKIITVLMSIMIILAVPSLETSAVDSVSVISGYYKNGNVCVFMDLNNDNNLINGKYNIINNNILSDSPDVYPTKFSEIDSTVNYVFLIDVSTSMPYYKEQIGRIADSLLKNEKCRVNVSVATFGEKFTLVMHGLDNTGQIMSVVNGLDYTEEATDISGGLSDAFDYISDHEMKEKEVYEIILITDGIPYYEGDNTEENISKANNLLKEKIVSTPEVIVHSVCFGNWDEDIFRAVSFGTGMHESVSSENTPEQIGKSISEFTDNLYFISMKDPINLYSERISVSFFSFYNHQVYDLDNIRNYDQIDFEFLPFGEEIESLPISSLEEKTEEESSEILVNSELSEKTVPLSTTNDQKENQPIIILIIAGCGALILIMVLVFILVRKARSRNSEAKSRSAAIRMSVEIISGKYLTNKKVLFLDRELLIGTSKNCDLVFEDEVMTQKNTRIYIQDRIIFIEDLNETPNTYLEGMKLFSPNRLRSGNEINIGNTVFKLLF